MPPATGKALNVEMEGGRVLTVIQEPDCKDEQKRLEVKALSRGAYYYDKKHSSRKKT